MGKTAKYVVAILFTGIASAANGQTVPSNEYEMDVLRLLNETWREALYPDYAFAQPEILGAANDREILFHEVTLRGGGEYVVAVVCDEDCGNVDIKAYTETGVEAAFDDASAEESPRFAMIKLTPLASQRYRFDIDMFSCSNDPCYYAIGVFIAGAAPAAEATPPTEPSRTVPTLP